MSSLRGVVATGFGVGRGIGKAISGDVTTVGADDVTHGLLANQILSFHSEIKLANRITAGAFPLSFPLQYSIRRNFAKK